VADGHKDDAALTVLGSLLSGRTGRLYKSLVLDQKIANSAFAGQNSQKWEGYFSLSGVAKPGNTPEQVEQALYKEIEKLQKERVGDHELQKVKNQYAANNFRRLQSNFALMVQLLLADSGRGWRTFNEDPKELQAVTADDVQRVAKQYFTPAVRAVAIYYTKKSEGAADEDPLLAGLSDQEKAEVRRYRGMISQIPKDKLPSVLESLEQQEGSAPPEKKKVLEVVKKLLQEQIKKEGGK
jgi:predicted Zn-dependent peptidase